MIMINKYLMLSTVPFQTYFDDVEGALVAQVDAVLVLLVHELARLELQALHARLQLGALSGTRLEDLSDESVNKMCTMS